MRVRDRATLDLLLLSAVHDAPGDGAAIVALVGECTGGTLALRPGTVYPALHRLERNRLVHRRRGTTTYRLTASGDRVLRGRRREFEQWVRAVRSVLPADAPPADESAAGDHRR